MLVDEGAVFVILQELSDEFRVSYCKLWQALIQEDQLAIKQYCMELQAGSLYRLLACMVTARAWANIETGITNSTRTKAEVTWTLTATVLLKNVVSFPKRNDCTSRPVTL